MKTGKKQFFHNHPILTMLLSMVLVPLYFLVVGVIQASVTMLLTGSREIGSLAGALVTIVASFLLLWFYQRKYYPDGRKFYHIQGFWPAFWSGWALTVVAVVSFLVERLTGKPMGSVLAAVILGIAPGIREELLCRIIPVSLLMRREDRKELITAAYLIPSLVFGLFHFVNLYSGADPILTLLQVAYATAVGLIFAAIYLKTGNLWVSILLHALLDFSAYLSADLQQTNGVLQASGSDEWIGYLVQLLYTAIFAANAFCLYRKNSREAIAQTWEKIC